MRALRALPPGSVILLVDWPSRDVPRALVNAGFTVLSANMARGTASSYSVVPGAGDGDEQVVITPLDAMPEHVDVVSIFRPPEEHAAITRRAVALGAHTVWVLRGGLSDGARRIAADAGLTVVDDAEVAGAEDVPGSAG
jgi:uncharacterized protein